MSTVRVIFIGDVVGAPGCAMIQKYSDKLRQEYGADLMVVNGENCAAKGRGITSKHVKFFQHNGIDMVTSGNHIWADQEVYRFLDQKEFLLRPANYPSACPGTGVGFVTVRNTTVAFVNLQGRVFMHEHLDCPFRTVESLLTYIRTKAKVIFVDFHAEATSEKNGMGYFLDGKVSGVVGTHTHIQTADARILPQGTAYMTDLGMTGSLNSMIGMTIEPILKRFLTQMPAKFEVSTTSPFVLSGCMIEADASTGRAIRIEPIRVVDEALIVQ